MIVAALLERSKLQIAIEGLGTLGLKENLPLGRAKVGGLVHQFAVHEIFHVIMVDHQFQLVPFSVRFFCLGYRVTIRCRDSTLSIAAVCRSL